MKAAGLDGTDDSVALFTSSAAAKRAYFFDVLQPSASSSTRGHWQRERDRQRRTCTRPEIVRVLCGHKLHRLRLVGVGGPAVLLDHPQLDRTAEVAMVALGAPMPACLMVLDAIAGRVSDRRILWRRRAYAIASLASVRRSCRRRGPTPALELPLAERYAAFVRHRASLWLSRLLPADTDFDVRVIPPQALTESGHSTTPWSWRSRPGISPETRYRALTVHVPFDWHVSVERAHATALLTAFVTDARADRRGEMLRSLHGEARKVNYAHWIEWTSRIESVDCASPVSARRWQRASGPSRLAECASR